MARVYPNLAGFVTNYKDGGLAAPPPLATTETVLLVGTSPDGPNSAPVVVTLPQAAIEFFGDPYDSPKATLARAINDANNAGARAVQGMRIGGEYAALALKEANPASYAYVEIDPEVSFDIPEPTYQAGSITGDPLAPDVVDNYLFAISGFSENMAGGNMIMRFTLAGNNYEFAYTLPNPLPSSDIEVDAEAEGLPVAWVGSAYTDQSPDGLSGQFVRWDVGNMTNPTIAANPAVGQGLWANTPDTTYGNIDVGSNYGNLTMFLSYTSYRTSAVGTAVNRAMTAGAGRAAAMADLEYGWEGLAAKHYYLAGAGALPAHDDTTEEDKVRVIGFGDVGLPDGAEVIVGIDLNENFPGSLPPEMLCRIAANNRVEAEALAATHPDFLSYDSGAGFTPGVTAGTDFTLPRVERKEVQYVGNTNLFEITGGKKLAVGAFRLEGSANDIAVSGAGVQASVGFRVEDYNQLTPGDQITLFDGTTTTQLTAVAGAPGANEFTIGPDNGQTAANIAAAIDAVANFSASSGGQDVFVKATATGTAPNNNWYIDLPGSSYPKGIIFNSDLTMSGANYDFVDQGGGQYRLDARFDPANEADMADDGITFFGGGITFQLREGIHWQVSAGDMQATAQNFASAMTQAFSRVGLGGMYSQTVVDLGGGTWEAQITIDTAGSSISYWTANPQGIKQTLMDPPRFFTGGMDQGDAYVTFDFSIGTYSPDTGCKVIIPLSGGSSADVTWNSGTATWDCAWTGSVSVADPNNGPQHAGAISTLFNDAASPSAGQWDVSIEGASSEIVRFSATPGGPLQGAAGNGLTFMTTQDDGATPGWTSGAASVAGPQLTTDDGNGVPVSESDGDIISQGMNPQAAAFEIFFDSVADMVGDSITITPAGGTAVTVAASTFNDPNNFEIGATEADAMNNFISWFNTFGPTASHSVSNPGGTTVRIQDNSTGSAGNNSTLTISGGPAASTAFDVTGQQFLDDGLDNQPLLTVAIEDGGTDYAASFIGEIGGGGFNWNIVSGDLTATAVNLASAINNDAGINPYVEAHREGVDDGLGNIQEYVIVEAKASGMSGSNLGNSMSLSENTDDTTGVKAWNPTDADTSNVPNPADLIQLGELVPVKIQFIGSMDSGDPDYNPLMTLFDPDDVNVGDPDHVPFTNDNAALGNKDIGGPAVGTTQYGNLKVDLTTTAATVQLQRSTLVPTETQDDLFYYDAQESAIYIAAGYFDISNDPGLNIQVAATFYDDVKAFVSSIDVYAGADGFVYDAVPDGTGALPSGGKIRIPTAEVMFAADMEFRLYGTMYQDSTGGAAGANTINTALQEQTTMYGQLENLWTLPYIQDSTTEIELMDPEGLPTGETVSIEVIQGTAGTALAQVRVKDIENPDIVEGGYRYPYLQGSPVGIFGRSIIVDEALASGESLRIPYIKADDNGEAILMKRGAGGQAPVVGTVMKSDHEDAVFTLNSGNSLQAGEYWYYTDVALYLRAIYPGSVYGNGVWDGASSTTGVGVTIDLAGSLVTDQMTMRVSKPAGKGFPSEFDVALSASPTPLSYQDVTVGINSHRDNVVVEARFVADSDHPVANFPQYEKPHNLLDNTDVAPAYLIGGDDGVGKDPGYYAQKLLGTQYDTGLLQLLENQPIDIIVLVDMYLDAESRKKYFGRDRKFWYNGARGIVIVDSNGKPLRADPNDPNGNDTVTNFGQILAEHCYQTSLNGQERIGVISMSPATDTSMRGVQSRVTRLTKTVGDFVTPMYNGFRTTNPIDGRVEDIGRYLSVCAGPEILSATTGQPSTLEVVYAALTSTLPAEAATTHKPILNIGTLGYNYSNAQLDALTGFRYVTLYQFNNVAYVTDGITAAGDLPNKPGRLSDYTRLSTVRVVHSAMAGVRRVSNPFLGQPNSIPQRMALNTEVDEFLRSMVDAGVLSDYNFTILSTRDMQIIGALRIELELVVWLELRKITTVVSLSLPQG